MSPSATGGRSPDGEDTVATKSRSLPRRVNSLSAAANPLDPAKPAFSCDVQPHTLGTACFTVAPMSPSATGGRSPDGEDTVATKSRSLPRRVNSLSAAANPLDPAEPAFPVRRPAAHPRHRLLYCSADVPIGDWWQALDGEDTVATYLADCHDALVHSAQPRIRWIPQSPPFRCDVQPHTSAPLASPVAPMSPSATGGAPRRWGHRRYKSRSCPPRLKLSNN